MWTSPNYMSMLGIIAHFPALNGTPLSILLALRRVYGSHSGSNLSDILIQVLNEYELIEKIGWFMLDNCSNNDTMLEHLSIYLFSKGIFSIQINFLFFN